MVKVRPLLALSMTSLGAGVILNGMLALDAAGRNALYFPTHGIKYLRTS